MEQRTGDEVFRSAFSAPVTGDIQRSLADCTGSGQADASRAWIHGSLYAAGRGLLLIRCSISVNADEAATAERYAQVIFIC